METAQQSTDRADNHKKQTLREFLEAHGACYQLGRNRWLCPDLATVEVAEDGELFFYDVPTLSKVVDQIEMIAAKRVAAVKDEAEAAALRELCRPRSDWELTQTFTQSRGHLQRCFDGTAIWYEDGSRAIPSNPWLNSEIPEDILQREKHKLVFHELRLREAKAALANTREDNPEAIRAARERLAEVTNKHREQDTLYNSLTYIDPGRNLPPDEREAMLRTRLAGGEVTVDWYEGPDPLMKSRLFRTP